MKKIFILIFFTIFIFSFSSEIKQDIDISNMPLHNVLSILSKESGKNIIASQEAKNIVIDAYFERGDNIENILYILADAYNLSLERTSNTTIFSLKNEKTENKAKLILNFFDSLTNKPISNAEILLKDSKNYQTFSNKDGIAIFENLAKSAYILKISKEGYINHNEIINVDKHIMTLNFFLEALNSEIEENTNKISNLSNFYESNGKLIFTETFSLYNISADEVKKILLESFSEQIKVSSLDKINKILVVAERDILESVRKIIKDFDSNPKQVQITSEILDISNNLFEELGFDWVYSENSNTNRTSNTLTANILGKSSDIVTGTVFGSQLSIFRQFNNKSDVLNIGMNLLEATNDLVVSSIPTLTISSGEIGEFKVTEEVIVGEKRERKSKLDNDNGRHYITEPIFKEAGLILKVKPLIKDNNEIVLEISIELSDFKFKKNLLNVGEINSGTYNSDGGSKIGRSLSTTVKIKNGDTILLGGLKKSIKQTMESKIPLLGDIPIINFFFKNISSRNENSDMYIKLKVDIKE
ncbi:MAG: type II secretion system protein GspD [Fusobacterium sp.]|nr:type II secretion system protein GspD [Fusobacterium sp.]